MKIVTRIFLGLLFCVPVGAQQKLQGQDPNLRGISSIFIDVNDLPEIVSKQGPTPDAIHNGIQLDVESLAHQAGLGVETDINKFPSNPAMTYLAIFVLPGAGDTVAVSFELIERAYINSKKESGLVTIWADAPVALPSSDASTIRRFVKVKMTRFLKAWKSANAGVTK